MKNNRPMRVLTAQLGLKLSNRTKRITPALAKLLDGLTEINTRYSDHKGIRVIRASEDIKKEAEELFDRIGSLVWPDLDEKTKFPTWLLNPSNKVSKLSKHYPRHLQYSNHADRAILAELFYPFVCGRLYNSVNKAENKSRVGKRPGSKHYSSSEEASNPGEDDVSADDNGENTGDRLPIPRAASLESQSYTPRSAGRRGMPPNIAPVAPMFSHQSSMDNDQTELGAINSEHTCPGSMQYPKQHKRAKKSRLGQLDAGSAEPYTYAGLGGLPFHTPSETLSRSYDPSEQPQSYTTQQLKRPFINGTSESSTKRSKISPTVHIPKPSLIVTLKLTPAKDVLDRRRNAPPQQPHISTPSSELLDLDEILAGRSMAPVDRQSDVADFESWTQIGDHQPTAGQQASVKSVAESAPDTTPVPSGPDTIQTVPDAPTLADDDTQSPNAMQPQPHLITQALNRQAIANFLHVWSGEPQQICDTLLLAALQKFSAEELVFEHLLPWLVKTLDEVTVNAAQGDLLALSTHAQEVVTEQVFGLRQPGRTVLNNSYRPSDETRLVQPTEDIASSSNIRGSNLSVAEIVDHAANGSVQMEGAPGAPQTAGRTTGAATETGADTNGPAAQHSRIDPGQTPHSTSLAGSSISRSMGHTFQSTDAELERLVEDIDMTVHITREDGSVVMENGAIGLEDIRNSVDFFGALQADFGHRLRADEDFFRAAITQLDDRAVDQRKPLFDLCKERWRNRSWKKMLMKLRRDYEQDGKGIDMELVADVIVMKKSDTRDG